MTMLSEKVAVVTGAARGIGRAIALRLAAFGRVRPRAGAGERRGHLIALDIAQELEDVHEPRARDEPFVAHVLVAPEEVAQELHLARRAWREVGMTALGRDREVAAAVGHEAGLPEARPGRDHRDGAPGRRPPGADYLAGLFGEARDGVGEGLEIVQQEDRRTTQPGTQRRRVDDPG
jgi:NAD(P)-dependent dehydrogenase (short-subunit alcohol dehydrogenase family)